MTAEELMKKLKAYPPGAKILGKITKYSTRPSMSLCEVNIDLQESEGGIIFLIKSDMDESV